MNAGLRRRRIKDELRFPVFLRDRVVVINYDRAVWIPVRRYAHTKNGVVQNEGQGKQSDQHKHHSKENTLEFLPQSANNRLGHGADYMLRIVRDLKRSRNQPVNTSKIKFLLLMRPDH